MKTGRPNQEETPDIDKQDPLKGLGPLFNRKTNNVKKK
jgi:hypothetical protein